MNLRNSVSVSEICLEMEEGKGRKEGGVVPAKSAVYVWGYNDSGQTATARARGTKYLPIPRSLAPTLFKNGEENHKNNNKSSNIQFMDISCGREHTAVVASDGSLYTWGSNSYGQLGDGTEDDRSDPKRIEAFKTEFVKSVACGAHCTAAIAEPRKKDGTHSGSRLWIWGQNQGSNLPRLFYGAFAPNTVIIQVSCGATHVAALSEAGVLQTWGYNEYGQLGRGFTCEGLQGARIVDAFLKHLDETPEKKKIVQLSCGEYHTAAIADNGDLYTWGLGNMGQLGHRSLQYNNKELLPRRVVGLEGITIRHVSCGGIHTCAVTDNGALYIWGGGQSGQLGLGPLTGYLSCMANDVQMFLRNIPVLVIPSGVQIATCGHSHTLVSMKDGKILGWGYNSYGQAATDKMTYAWYPSPVDWYVGEVRRLAAGGGHSAVLTHAYSLKELCEFKLADLVTFSNAPMVEDVASRTGADALARLCERLSGQKLSEESQSVKAGGS